MRFFVLFFVLILFLGCVSETKESAKEIKNKTTEPSQKQDTSGYPVKSSKNDAITEPPQSVLKTPLEKSAQVKQPAEKDTTFKNSSINRNIKVDIIVDTDSYSPTDSELNEFFRITNNVLVEKTDVEMKLVKIKRISYSEIKNSLHLSRPTYNDDVLNKIYESDTWPEFFIFLRADDSSATYGGYSISFARLSTCNRYKSPLNSRTDMVYGGVMDWKHTYSSCGYDRTDPKHLAHISNVSIGGECRNRKGTPCIYRSDFNYYMCDDSESLDSFYAENRYNFIATTAIHELMHNFGSDGNYDHFGTAKCAEIMGGHNYDDGTLNTSQKNAGICPKLFDVFNASYREC